MLLRAAFEVLGVERCIAGHVHHGLQAAADGWPEHCAREAARLGVRFECIRLDGAPSTGDSVEQWARDRRYRALTALARKSGASCLLTAHHRDDQIETLLIRIARGTGIEGLAGIREERLLEEIVVARPFLGLDRSTLAQCARAWACRWIEDPSNLDTTFLRNAIRHRLLPVLDEVVPAFRSNLVRLSGHLEAARRAVSDLAALDLEQARVAAARRRAATPAVESGGIEALAQDALDAETLSRLPSYRRYGALRAWIASESLLPPTERRLIEIDRQLLRPGSARAAVRHDKAVLRQELGWVFVDLDGAPGGDAGAGFVRLRWRGEATIELPKFAGRLCFESAPAPVEPHGTTGSGVSSDWLRTVTLDIGRAPSRSRIRPSPEGRSRTLKNLYQEARVPASSRWRLPSVLVGDRVLYASGVGMDRSPDWPCEGVLVRLRWVPCAAAGRAVV